MNISEIHFDSLAVQHTCSCNSVQYVMIVQTFAGREIWRFDLLDVNSYELEYVPFACLIDSDESENEMWSTDEIIFGEAIIAVNHQIWPCLCDVVCYLWPLPLIQLHLRLMHIERKRQTLRLLSAWSHWQFQPIYLVVSEGAAGGGNCSSLTVSLFFPPSKSFLLCTVLSFSIQCALISYNELTCT